VKRLAAGRASNVYELDDRRVLRLGGDPEREARVMAHARAAGYPVPAVHEVRSEGLVLERIDGSTMLADLRRRPWRLRRHALLLASLHERLHAIPYEAASLLHLDLHPDNVLLSPAGPIVIDWTNAGSGPPALDVALTWTILATSGGLPGRAFARLFVAAFEREELRQALPAAAAFRSADPNVTEAERAAVQALLARHRSGV
jgi:aminoglycoside phosphotransferase (APT) family kinase protein